MLVLSLFCLIIVQEKRSIACNTVECVPKLLHSSASTARSVQTLSCLWRGLSVSSFFCCFSFLLHAACCFNLPCSRFLCIFRAQVHSKFNFAPCFCSEF